jgi:hypothetical protein
MTNENNGKRPLSEGYEPLQKGFTPKEKHGYSPTAEKRPIVPPKGGSGFVPPPVASNKK